VDDDHFTTGLSFFTFLEPSATVKRRAKWLDVNEQALALDWK
jgi:hypothetical protein